MSVGKLNLETVPRLTLFDGEGIGTGWETCLTFVSTTGWITVLVPPLFTLWFMLLRFILLGVVEILLFGFFLIKVCIYRV